MNTILLHSYEYLRMHVHPAMTAERVKPRASYLRELLPLAERTGKIALLIGMAYVALVCCEKIAASAYLTAHYCDLSTIVPIVLAAP